MNETRRFEIKRLYEEIRKFRVAARYSNWQLSHDQVDQILFALRDLLAEVERLEAECDELKRLSFGDADSITRP